MITKGKALDAIVKAHILDCVDSTGYQDTLPTHREDKILFLRDTFYSEYGWAVRQYGEQKALREWFQGLPSACTPASYDGDIIELAEKWGSLPKDATETQQHRIINNWFDMLAAKTCQLFREVDQ